MRSNNVISQAASITRCQATTQTHVGGFQAIQDLFYLLDKGENKCDDNGLNQSNKNFSAFLFLDPQSRKLWRKYNASAHLCSPNDSGGRILLLLEIISQVQITSHQKTWVQTKFNRCSPFPGVLKKERGGRIFAIFVVIYW